VLQLRVFGASAAMAAVVERLSELPGARHITRTDSGARAGETLVTADLHADAADPALEAISRLGVAPDDVALLRLDSIQPGGRRREGANLVWADLLGQAGQNARPVARYLVFMAVAGVIAAYGVLYANGILIVGAMAVSPDILPIAAICVGLVLRRQRLARRACVTLAVGLGVAGLVAGVLTAMLDVLGLLPDGFKLGEGALSGLTTVNSSTVMVALVAGAAGMLALESRASSAVGVAISVTTIPASAYLGVAAGVGELGKAEGALLVLSINVAMLVAGGTGALVVQRALNRGSGSDGSSSSAETAAE
jgi:uncharacterized hydrophobic protein (TIGR00271 family)